MGSFITMNSARLSSTIAMRPSYGMPLVVTPFRLRQWNDMRDVEGRQRTGSLTRLLDGSLCRRWHLVVF